MVRIIIQSTLLIASAALAANAAQEGEMALAGFNFGFAVCCYAFLKDSLDNKRR